MKEKLKKPLINPWRLNPARYGQDFSSAFFSEQEHEAAFLLQLFPGDSQVPEEDPKRFTELFLWREWLPGKSHCCPRTVRRQGSPAQTFGSFYLLGGNFPSSRSGLFIFPPDRRKLLCNIQEVTFIRLNSISKIKSMEKQILVLDGKCWH